MIGVVGSINMDQVVITERIPAKGETLLGKDIKYNPGGKGGNQAVAIAKLGGNVVMFGKLGDDANGKELLKNMAENGVNVDYIQIEKGVDSGLAIITVGENDNTIIVVPGANRLVDIEYIKSIENQLLQCEMVIMQQEIPTSTNEYVIELCAKNGIKTLLNPAPAAVLAENIIAKVDFLTPNEHEAKLIFADADIKEILLTYPEKLIITQGEKGVILADSDKKIISIPSIKADVVDTTGAGDTFNAALAYALVENMSLTAALHFANIAAGLATEKLGAQNGMPQLEAVLAKFQV